MRPGTPDDDWREDCAPRRVLDLFVEHAVGSLARPMSDDALAAKFLGLTDGVLPTSITRTCAEAAPAARAEAATSCSRSSRRAARIRFAPSRPNNSAAAAPKPLDTPRITA